MINRWLIPKGKWNVTNADRMMLSSMDVVLARVHTVLITWSHLNTNVYKLLRTLKILKSPKATRDFAVIVSQEVQFFSNARIVLNPSAPITISRLNMNANRSFQHLQPEDRSLLKMFKRQRKSPDILQDVEPSSLSRRHFSPQSPVYFNLPRMTTKVVQI